MDRLVSASIGLLFLFAFVAPATLVLTPPATPTEVVSTPVAGSLYSLNLQIETADGSRIGTSALAGKPRIVTMFYTHCQSLCPLAIQSLKELDRSLSPTEQQALGYVLLSLDPQRDAPEVLRERARVHGLDASRWMLARTSSEEVSRAADFLGVRWRPLANGELDHAGALVLLDGQGRELSRTTSIGTVDAAFLSDVRKAVQGSATP